jgi:hypothetical protein
MNWRSVSAVSRPSVCRDGHSFSEAGGAESDRHSISAENSGGITSTYYKKIIELRAPEIVPTRRELGTTIVMS